MYLQEFFTRRRFLTDFHDNLSYKLQKNLNVNCWLSVIYNWFNNKTYWSAKYSCIEKECKVNFDCKIESQPKINQDVFVCVVQNGICIHKHFLKEKRYTAEF
ncbi:hypothetical protein BpHYR1_008136 [Brachionus plicatilis]|uniref:Uncharacterized protein n=1 Tax=Brachionus plicatilis TaxID=10195 RepID=A0A3M7QXP5_BRAPC|nr:hypothetical protein BpHYR1_008136 [Brachionus plicatilis]